MKNMSKDVVSHNRGLWGSKTKIQHLNPTFSENHHFGANFDSIYKFFTQKWLQHRTC